MVITLFGVIWLILLIVCLFLPFKYTYAVLILSSIFQSVSVINFSNNGIYPMLITEAFLIIRFLMMKKSKVENDDITSKKLVKNLLIFLFIGTIISIIAPILFSSFRTFDYYSESNVRLSFNFSVIVRIVTLLCNILTIYILYKSKNLLSNSFILKCFIFSILVCILIGFWEFFAKKTNNLDLFPYDIFYNNISYKQGYNQSIASGNVRMNSTFLEASYLGCFITASFFGIISINKEGKYNLILALLFLCLILNLSGTGIISFIIMLVYYLFFYKKLKFKKKTLLLSLLLVIFAGAILFEFGVLGKMYNMIFNKINSVSGVIRLSVNDTALDIFSGTYFVGGGFSCFRASSFLINCLAEVGIIGTMCLFITLVKYLRSMYKKSQNNNYCKFGIFYFVASIISMIMSIPDITFMLLWIPLYYLVSINDDEVLL